MGWGKLYCDIVKGGWNGGKLSCVVCSNEVRDRENAFTTIKVCGARKIVLSIIMHVG